MNQKQKTLYLTRNHKIDATPCPNRSLFFFSENNEMEVAKWISENMKRVNDSFVILDKNEMVLNQSESILSARNYYVEVINTTNNPIHINPFDCVDDVSELHTIVDLFVRSMHDPKDKDIPAMVSAVDAFASCLFLMFSHQKKRVTMKNLKVLISSLGKKGKKNDIIIPLSDLVFEEIKNPEALPRKYYEMYKKEAQERFDEISQKIINLFNELSDSDLESMKYTEDMLIESLDYGTALFLNEAEPLHRFFFYVLNMMANKKQEIQSTFIIQNLSMNTLFPSLHEMVGAAKNMSFIIGCTSLTEFAENEKNIELFNEVKGKMYASILSCNNGQAMIAKSENDEKIKDILFET